MDFHLRELERLINETKQTTLGLLKHVKSTVEEKPNKIRESKAEYKTKFDDQSLDLPEEFTYTGSLTP